MILDYVDFLPFLSNFKHSCIFRIQYFEIGNRKEKYKIPSRFDKVIYD